MRNTGTNEERIYLTKKLIFKFRRVLLWDENLMICLIFAKRHEMKNYILTHNHPVALFQND